jgi:hypothetical protein
MVGDYRPVSGNILRLGKLYCITSSVRHFLLSTKKSGYVHLDTFWDGQIFLSFSLSNTAPSPSIQVI